MILKNDPNNQGPNEQNQWIHQDLSRSNEPSDGSLVLKESKKRTRSKVTNPVVRYTPDQYMMLVDSISVLISLGVCGDVSQHVLLC